MTNLNLNVNTNTNTSSNVIVDDKTKFVNLTPHDVVLKTVDGSFLTIKSSGVARVSTSFEVKKIVCGVIVGETTYGEITGLPEPQQDTLFVVSLPFIKAAPERHDLVVPYDCVRNEKGLVEYANSCTK